MLRAQLENRRQVQEMPLGQQLFEKVFQGLTWGYPRVPQPSAVHQGES